MSEEDRGLVTRTIPVARERVFEAWLDPEMLRRFMCPAPGVELGHVAVEPREGGAFEIVMLVGERELPHRGIYESIQRPERLIFTWESANAPAGSRVTIDFAQIDAEATEVTLLHENLGSRSSRQDHLGGWTHILETLTGIQMEATSHG